MPVEHQVMQVLLCLANRAGEVVSREEVLETVWAETTPNDEGLTQAICKLRKVLGDRPKQSQVIQTIRKVGYRLLLPVTSTPDSVNHDRHTPSSEFSGRVPKHHIRIRIHGSWLLLAGLVLITALNIWIFL